MKKRHIFAIAIALILPALYHKALAFFYSVIIAETPLLHVPWIENQVRTNGLGLDALFCAVLTLLLLPVYFWIKRSDTQPRPQPRVNGRIFLQSVVITIGAGGIIVLINLATQFLLSQDTEGAKSIEQFNETFATAPDVSVWFVSFLSIAIFGPIVEEVLFRGILYNGVRMIRGGLIPVFVTAIYFGLWHSSPVQIAYTMVLGLVFGFIYYVTNSLWLAMAMHILNNALSALPPALDTDTTAIVLMILKFGLLPFALWQVWKLAKQTRAETPLLADGTVAVR